MSYKYFASRTLYQIVAVMEILFSVVILIFSSLTLKVLHDQHKEFQEKNQILLYSGVLGIIVSVIQAISAFALVWSSRGENSFDKDDLAVSRIPTIWFFLAFINLSLLVFIFIGPLLQVKEQGELKRLVFPLPESLTHLFTYVVANAIFKVLFIWAVFTTIRCCSRRSASEQR